MQTKSPVVLTFLFPRLQDILFISILFVVAIYYGPKLFNLDGDLGRHITIGKYIIESRHIPTQDIFSHTMTGQRLVPHEWLAQIILSAAYLLMGLNGDVLLTAVIIAYTFILVYREILERGGFRLVALFVALWAAAASSLHWLARPHIFTFLFLAIWTYSLEHFVLGKPKHIWLFPVLMLVWANTHGAFIAGFVVWSVYFVEWIWDFWQGRSTKELGVKLGLIGLSSLAITFINPSGWYLWQTSVGYIGNNYLVSHTLEYLPPNFHDSSTWPFMFLLAYGLFALVLRKKLRLRDAMLLAGWSIMGMYSARNIPLFAIVTAPIFGTLIQSQVEDLPRLTKQDAGLRGIESQLRGDFWPVLAVLFLGFIFWRNIPLPLNQSGNRYDPQTFPVKAVDWLTQHPQQGNTFNDFMWGGYLLYRTWPQQLVFIDGQTDFYGESLTREYEQVITLNAGWENVFKKYDIKWVIIPPEWKLANQLTANGWDAIYQDSTALILRYPK
jgi:hypothetical protein